ncbi:hypothetical protein LguiB_011050 [Lonicera macranthoides]
MERWSGILRVPLYPNSRACYKVAVSLCLSSSSKTPTVPSANAIFFNGDRVEGTGNPVIERLSDLSRIAEVLVSKLGVSVNAWVIDASNFNGPFAIYKDFIPSVNKWGEPQSYDATGFPASTSIASLLLNCVKEAENAIPEPREHNQDGVSTSDLDQPKTLLFGFSKGGTVLNQLLSELGSLESKSTENPCLANGLHTPTKNNNPITPTSKEALLNSIAEIHYVDVGLNSSGAYLSDRNVIEGICKRVTQGGSGIRFVFHGTPRQWCDSMRVWIREEKDTLVRLLKLKAERSAGRLEVCERIYFAGKTANLQMHFEVIEVMDVS